MGQQFYLLRRYRAVPAGAAAAADQATPAAIGDGSATSKADGAAGAGASANGSTRKARRKRGSRR
jgi:hypothetical protein